MFEEIPRHSRSDCAKTLENSNICVNFGKLRVPSKPSLQLSQTMFAGIILGMVRWLINQGNAGGCNIFLKTGSTCLAWWKPQLSIITVSPTLRSGFPKKFSSSNASEKKLRSSSPLEGSGNKLTCPTPYILCRRFTVKVALLAYRWTSKAGWPILEMSVMSVFSRLHYWRIIEKVHSPWIKSRANC